MDDWSTDTTAYSIDKFYTQSTDKRGHTEHIRVGLPPGLLAKVQELVQGSQFPDYRTSQDIVRDAVYHRLHYLADQNDLPDLRHIIEQEIRMVERQALIASIERQEDAIELVGELLSKASRVGDFLALEKALLDAEKDLDTMIDPYKQQMVNLIRKYRAVQTGERGK